MVLPSDCAQFVHAWVARVKRLSVYDDVPYEELQECTRLLVRMYEETSDVVMCANTISAMCDVIRSAMLPNMHADDVLRIRADWELAIVRYQCLSYELEMDRRRFSSIGVRFPADEIREHICTGADRVPREGQIMTPVRRSGMSVGGGSPVGYDMDTSDVDSESCESCESCELDPGSDSDLNGLHDATTLVYC